MHWSSLRHFTGDTVSLLLPSDIFRPAESYIAIADLSSRYEIRNTSSEWRATIDQRRTFTELDTLVIAIAWMPLREDQQPYYVKGNSVLEEQFYLFRHTKCSEHESYGEKSKRAHVE